MRGSGAAGERLGISIMLGASRFLGWAVVGAFLCVALGVVAHPGGLDARGGHHDRKNGGYHYHNGGGGGSGAGGSSGFGRSGGGFGSSAAPRGTAGSPRVKAGDGVVIRRGVTGIEAQPMERPVRTPEEQRLGTYEGRYTVKRRVVYGDPKAAGGWADGEGRAPLEGEDGALELPESLILKVVEVADGDTVTGRKSDGEAYAIRLHGVDAPEARQAFGAEAKAFVSEACLGETVKAEITGVDRHGRLVARVLLPDGRMLNEALVAAGLAHWYEAYAPGAITLKVLQGEARAAGRGLWSGPSPVPPWEFRREGEEALETVAE